MEKNTIFERLRAGEQIKYSDAEIHKLREESYKTKKLILQMNQSSDPEEIRLLLQEITRKPIDPSIGIFTPFYINYGRNTQIGRNVFINFNCTILDFGGVTIEDDVFIAPNVSLLTEGHPVEPSERRTIKASSILIKKNVWIGAGSTILQGVTIGENAVVAAGSVVNKDVPPNTLVGGIPAKILKQLK